MALGKMLQLGGIDNRPPKTDQVIGKFRVARNVMPSPDGKLIPRYENEAYNVDTDVYEIHCMAQDNSSLLTLKSVNDTVTSQGSVYQLDKNTTIVPSSVQAGRYFLSGPDDTYSQKATSYKYNNTTFFQCPYEGFLLKYDGVETRKAGCEQPNVKVNSGYSAAANRHIRIVQHTIDFDGNEPVSESIYIPADASGSMVIETSAISNIIGSAGVFPTYTTPTFGLNEGWFKSNAVTTFSVNEFIATGITNLHEFYNRIGSYVIVSGTKELPAATGQTFNTLGIALKVNSVTLVSGTTYTIKLSADDAYFLNEAHEWVTGSLSSLFASSIDFGTKTFVTAWESVAANGVYYYRGICPSFPYSITTLPVSVFTITTTGAALATAGSTDTMFNISPTLNEWYDISTKKLDPNSQFGFGGEPYSGFGGGNFRPFYCMTVYQDTLMLANDAVIYYSDSSNAGSFEQFEASAQLIIGSKQYGRLTSICATQEFIVVSRERKNYYVNGNILTGNYGIQEIVGAELGAWSNNASIVVKDSVVFINSLGVYQVMGGGRVELLSKTCPKNFDSFDNSNVNEDVVFRLTGFVSTLETTDNAFSMLDDGLAVAYDEYRELLVFCKKGRSQTGNPMFVLHTKTGEFYEWDGVLIGAEISDIFFMYSKMYVGLGDYSTIQAGVYVENKTIAMRYPETNPIKLYSSWMTAGEPSLEKILLQLKFFGRVKTIGSTTGLKVVAFKDWDYSTKITDSYYFPKNTALSLNNQVQYSHKKRLDSNKVLAASVGIESSVNGSGSGDVTFELESMEIEFNAIQDGVKK